MLYVNVIIIIYHLNSYKINKTVYLIIKHYLILKNNIIITEIII